MKRRFAIYFSVAACTMLSAYASDDHITNVQFDGRDCTETKGIYRADQIDFRVNIENRDDRQATLGFYPLPGSDPVARVNLIADLVAQPLAFTPQGDGQAYKPTMTIAQYTQRLNDLAIPGFRRFIWNQDGLKTLLRNRSGPVVAFEQRRTLKFYESLIKHDDKAHTSSVYMKFGLENDEARNEFLVYQFSHERVPTSLNQYLWLDAQKNIRTLVSVVYNALPESVRRSWADAKLFEPLPYYAELEDQLAEQKLLNVDSVDVPQSGLYFRKDHGSPLESKYVYVAADGKYYMTRLRKVSSQLLQKENQGANGFVFTAMEGQGPELHILGHTNYPLLLDPAAILAPQFRANGYYRPASMNWDNQNINQTFVEFPDSGNVVVYKSRKQSAFSEADLTSIILSSVTKVDDLTECIQHFNMAHRGVLIPKIIVRLANQESVKKVEASDRLLPLIEACMASRESIDQTDFGQLVLTDPTLQKFLRPHMESFPKMHLDADELRFGSVVLSNPLVEWLWTNRFQFQTLKKVNAHEVHLSCLGNNNDPLTKLSELRSIKPPYLRVSFETLGTEDRENLISVIRDNPHLTELHFSGAINVVGSKLLKVIADHPSLVKYHYKIDGEIAQYQGMSDAQVNAFFVKSRLGQSVHCDLTNPVLSRLTPANAAIFLKMNNIHVEELTLGKDCPLEIAEAIGILKNLKKLKAANPNLTDGEVTRLSRSLRQLTKLKEVTIHLPSYNSFNGYQEVHTSLAMIQNLEKLTLLCGDWPSWNKKQTEQKRNENKDLKKITIAAE